MNISFYITVTYTYNSLTYIITMNLQLCSVNMTIAVCFRVKCFMSNTFLQYVIYPDKSAKIYSVQSYVNGISPKITSPALCR